MEAYAEKIEGIAQKLDRLLDKHQRLLDDNSRLSDENRKLQAELQTKSGKLEEMEEQLKLLQLAKSISSENGSANGTEVKRKINEFIREIDNCIAMLNV